MARPYVKRSAWWSTAQRPIRKKRQAACHPDKPYYCKDLCQRCYAVLNHKRYYQANVNKVQTSNKQYIRNRPEWYLWRIAKARAKKFGHDFTIDISDVKIPPLCPVLEIPLVPFSGRHSHNSPSIDRIDNSKGYVKDNVIVVSFRANSLKRDATLDELTKLANFYTALKEAQ